MTEKTDPQELARRYVDLWQKQLSGMVFDPNAMALMARGLALGEQAAALMMQGAHPDGAGTEAGTAPAAAASADPDGDVDELRSRIAVLERRLAELEA